MPVKALHTDSQVGWPWAIGQFALLRMKQGYFLVKDVLRRHRGMALRIFWCKIDEILLEHMLGTLKNIEIGQDFRLQIDF